MSTPKALRLHPTSDKTPHYTRRAPLPPKPPPRDDEVWLEEPIQLGQRITRFRVQVGADSDEDSEWRELATGTTIGARRILRVGETNARRIRVSIDGALAAPALSRLSLYLSPPRVELDPPTGVSVTPLPVRLTSRKGALIRYTVDDSEVTTQSPAYDEVPSRSPRRHERTPRGSFRSRGAFSSDR